MTTHQFTSHGLNFVIEGDGFMHARHDFDATAGRVEMALEAMPADEVAQLHAAAMADGAKDVFDGPAAIAINDIAGKIKAEVTREWHRPNGCDVSLTAAQ